jgi:hypothetical protein
MLLPLHPQVQAITSAGGALRMEGVEPGVVSLEVWLEKD